MAKREGFVKETYMDRMTIIEFNPKEFSSCSTVQLMYIEPLSKRKGQIEATTNALVCII